MSRPEVSVVMPFAGDAEAAQRAARSLLSLDVERGDELILVDNSGTVTQALIDSTAAPGADDRPAVALIRAVGERSPAHARNTGASRARAEWILFLDADTEPVGGLLGAFFESEISDDVGAVAGEVVSAADAPTLVARYGAARSFLSQQRHLEHPYRPRVVAANLLVRRSAFEQVGGFYEGVRAAEDTDFSWRLQEAGWRLELRSGAGVEHRYRSTLSELRRQWRGYAAGRAWLARRYEGFEPEPAVHRALRRARERVGPDRAAHNGNGQGIRRGAPPVHAGRLERGRYAAIDALLSLEELAGLALSNRPRIDHDRRAGGVDVVLVADRFPARGDPLVELAGTLERARVEATSRPAAPDLAATRRLPIDYLEDDGAALRVLATAVLALRHPVRVLLDFTRHAGAPPPLRVLAPAVWRLERDPRARVHSLGGGHSRDTAQRLARLAGRSLDQ